MPTIPSSQLWTGTLNQQALPPPTVRRAGLYDTTLRDGEQAVGVVLDPRQKLAIAQHLDALGVDRIEAGFPRVSEDDRRAIELITRAGVKAELWGFARAVIEDVRAVTALGLRHTVIEAPISDFKLQALGLSRDEVQKRILNAVTQAAKEGVKIAFFGVDGSRADLAFAERVYKGAVDAGAAEVVVVDTLGIASPEAVSFLVQKTRSWVGDRIPIHFHGHNDFGLATANAIAAVKAGAAWVHGTIDGMGERAGNADLGQVALSLGALYGIETNLRLDRVRAASAFLRQTAGYALEPWKAVVGDNLFVRETGAVAAQFHLPQAIEPYSSELLDTPRRIVLGKKSGLASIQIKLREFALKVPPEKEPVLLAAVKDLAVAKHALVTDAEFHDLVRNLA